MNDLIIGMASGYTDEDLRPFVNSLKRTGYEGDLVLIRQNPYACHPILARFALIPRFIHEGHRYVIACDTSDIVFQSNPTVWLDEHLGDHNICVVSEGTTFRESEGNRKNMRESFGEEQYELMKDSEVCNAGVIAGYPFIVADICRQIYNLCLQDKRLNAAPIKTLTWDEMISDQSALNILLYKYNALIVHASDNFVHEYSHPGNGENAAILHQYLYNRREEIRQKYNEV